MDGLDNDVVVQGVLGGGAIGTFLWALYERWLRLKVVRAQTDVQVVGLEGQESVYSMLKDRLEEMQKELNSIRDEVAIERKHSRKMEIHIFKLESLMRKAGIEPPVFDET